MQKLLDLRRRMKSVENIRAITRTLATVSAAKLSSSRRRAAGLREYARGVREMLAEQLAYLERQGVGAGALSPLLARRAVVRSVAALVVTSDRGMCGSYNLATCRLAVDLRREHERAARRVLFVAKGRKGERYLRRRGAEVFHADGWQRHAGVPPDELERLRSLLVDLFSSGEVDEVYAVYTQFRSPIARRPRVRRLLPVPIEDDEPHFAPVLDRWFYEPSLREVLGELLSIYLGVQLEDVLLGSYASEQGARMITMEEATARAEKALWEHRVQYNRLRREAITTDLLGTLFASRVAEEVKRAPERTA